MTTRSAVLAAGVLSTTRPAPLLYTCAPNTVVIIKRALIYYVGANEQIIELLVNRAPQIGPRFLHVDVLNLEVVDHETWTVMEPGDQIFAVYSYPTIYYWISGAVLPARPTN